MENSTFNYSIKEERINVLTHFIGLIFSVLALILLLIKGYSYDHIIYLISYAVFGLSLIILYLASTLYHHEKSPILRRRLNIFDHSAIYVLIAGTYTPYTLLSLSGTIGWVFFTVSWSIAFLGIIFKLFFTGKFDKISTILYVAMGWMVIFVAKPLVSNLSLQALIWLIAGGVFYTLGAFIYSLAKIKYNHAIFHVFVLLGSISHFISIYFFVN